MCVRFLRPEQQEELKRVVDELRVTVFRVCPEELADCSGGEASPGMTAPLVGMGGILCEGLWGFGRGVGKGVVFNSRIETLMTSRLWSPHIRRGRCVVPAKRYFEWEHLGEVRGRKFRIGRRDGGMLLMAGVARRENGKALEFSVVTQPAADGIRHVHDRMPLLLDGSGAAAWLDACLLPDECLARNGCVDVMAEADVQAGR